MSANIPNRLSHYHDLGVAFDDQCCQGTPVFIACAVELGKAVPPLLPWVLPRISAAPGCYVSAHPSRIRQFLPEDAKAPLTIVEVPTDNSESCVWRHELDHAAKSVFWLLCYWVITAQPKDSPMEVISGGTWDTITSEHGHNVFLGLLHSWADGSDYGTTIHSIYKPLWPLLHRLARILAID